MPSPLLPIFNRVRKFVGDRRRATRSQLKRNARLLFSVSPLNTEGVRMLPLEGFTRDVSETGLALIVNSLHIGDTYLMDESCELRIVLLDLPTGEVEIHAAPVRYEQLDENAPGGGHLIGVRITHMNDRHRARFVEYLRTSK
jgi:hypothetical protein